MTYFVKWTFSGGTATFWKVPNRESERRWGFTEGHEVVAARPPATLRTRSPFMSRAKRATHKMSVAANKTCISTDTNASPTFVAPSLRPTKPSTRAPPTLMPPGVGEFGCEIFDDMKAGLEGADVVKLANILYVIGADKWDIDDAMAAAAVPSAAGQKQHVSMQSR